MKSAQTVRQGTITSMARNFGATRKATGSKAMVLRASTSSVTFLVPISAAKADPERPMTTMAVSRGPSSRRMEMATAAGHQLHRSQLAQLIGALQGHDQANKERNQRDNGDGFDAYGHGLMESSLGAQWSTAERSHEGEIGRLAREGRQVTHVGQAIQGPDADKARYGYDFFGYFQRRALPIQRIVSAAFRVGHR